MKLVKCAQSIARDVMKFWGKARAVYNFMIQEKVNEIKRSKMDKDLETFVQQSERYVLCTSKPSRLGWILFNLSVVSFFGATMSQPGSVL